MSKTYKLTNKGRKIDWLPNYPRSWWNLDELDEQNLLKIIKETQVYPEERTYIYRDINGNHKIHNYTVMVNQYTVKLANRKLQCLYWWKNNPHRKNDMNDYFFISYAKNPSSWNHWTYTKRKRAFDKQLINKIKTGKIDADEAIFYHKKKPVIYYW